MIDPLSGSASDPVSGAASGGQTAQRPFIGVVAATASGRAASAALAAAWGEWVRVYERESVAIALRDAFAECGAVVSFLALGATVRVLAPLLRHKTTDPAVVCVDESRQFAIAVGEAIVRVIEQREVVVRPPQ